MENSRTRMAARTSNRLATFTTAMATTSRTIPIMMVSGMVTSLAQRREAVGARFEVEMRLVDELVEALRGLVH